MTSLIISKVNKRYIVEAIFFLLVMSVGLLHFFPGAMSIDSFVILEQARSGNFSDAHPPLLSLVWRHVDRIYSGPAGILIINLLLFNGGLLIFFKNELGGSSKRSLFTFITVALFPPIVAIIGVIWIDISMASFFVASIASSSFVNINDKLKKNNFVFSVLAVFFLFCAVSVRHNAAAAAFPILLYLAIRLNRDKYVNFYSSFKMVLVSGLSVVALFFASKQLTNYLVNERAHFWRVAATYDIAGVSYFEEKNLFYRELVKSFSLEDIKILYSPRSLIPLFFGVQVHHLGEGEPLEANRISLENSTPDFNHILFNNWVDVVLNNKSSYLKHRFLVFKSLVTRSKWGLWSTVFDTIPENTMGIAPLESRDSIYFKFVRLSAKTFIFVPIYYLLASFLGMAFVLSKIKTRCTYLELMPFVFFLSGVLHMLGLFFVAGSADSRYSHWLILSTLIGFMILLLKYNHLHNFSSVWRLWNKKGSRESTQDLGHNT